MRWPQAVHDVSAVLHAVASCALGTATGSHTTSIYERSQNIEKICIRPFCASNERDSSGDTGTI